MQNYKSRPAAKPDIRSCCSETDNAKLQVRSRLRASNCNMQMRRCRCDQPSLQAQDVNATRQMRSLCTKLNMSNCPCESVTAKLQLRNCKWAPATANTNANMQLRPSGGNARHATHSQKSVKFEAGCSSHHLRTLSTASSPSDSHICSRGTLLSDYGWCGTWWMPEQ